MTSDTREKKNSGMEALDLGILHTKTKKKFSVSRDTTSTNDDSGDRRL